MSTAHEPQAHQTPTAVLVGVGAFVVAALCALPAPFLLGIILTPAFTAIAVTSYLGKTWSTIAGAGASGLTALLALVSFGSAFGQPTVGMTVAVVLGSLVVLVSAALGFLGTGLIHFGRQRSSVHRPRDASTASTPWKRSHADFTDAPATAPKPATPPYPTAFHQNPDSSHPQQASDPGPDVDNDRQRVGRVASEGAYRLAKGSLSAWQAHREHVTARRARAAEREAQAQRSGKVPPLRFTTQDMERRKRQKEDDEIRKARVTQARKYNRRNSSWF